MDGGDLLHDPAFTGLAGVLGTGVLGWMAQRMVGRAALEKATSDATETALNIMKGVLEDVRQELRVAIKERDEARMDVAARTAHIEELRRTIQALELRIAAAPAPRVSGG